MQVTNQWTQPSVGWRCKRKKLVAYEFIFFFVRVNLESKLIFFFFFFFFSLYSVNKNILHVHLFNYLLPLHLSYFQLLKINQKPQPKYNKESRRSGPSVDWHLVLDLRDHFLFRFYLFSFSIVI